MLLPCSRMLRRLALLAVLVLAACGGGSDNDLPWVFMANLGGVQPTSQGNVVATGTGIVTVEADGRTLAASVVTTPAADTAAILAQRVNNTAPGVTISLQRSAGGDVWSGRATLTEDQFFDLRDGTFFFIVQSTTFPGNEIRGRVVESLPTSEEFKLLEQFSPQSEVLGGQLQQVRDIVDTHGWEFLGIGIGFTLFLF